MNHKQLSLAALCLGVTSSLLTGCSTQDQQPDLQLPPGAPSSSGQVLDSSLSATQTPSQVPQVARTNTTASQTPTTPSWSEKFTTPTTVQKTVAVSNACIGCGKCARIAATTFSMSNHRATVISQDYASSDAVQHAANNCPVQAISIA